MAVRRRPSYGFSLAGTSFGIDPEARASMTTLRQLFPEINLNITKDTETEEVEKPEEAVPISLPSETDIVGTEESIAGSAIPVNVQFEAPAAKGPQGRGSRLGYSGSTSSSAANETPTKVEDIPQTSMNAPEYQVLEFDFSPLESLLEQGRSILTGIQDAAQGMNAPSTMAAAEPQTETQPAPTEEPSVPLRLQVKQAAAGGKPTTLGQTGTERLLSQGVDPYQIERQARAAGISLGKKAQSTINRAQIQAIAQAPTGLNAQIQQIAKATDSGKITQSAVKSLIESGTSAKRIQKVAEKQGINIGKQAQQLLDKAKKTKNKK